MKFSSPTANCQLRGGHARPRRHALRASYDHKAEITLGRLPGTPLSSRGTRSASPGSITTGLGFTKIDNSWSSPNVSLPVPMGPGLALRAPRDDDRI
ncbi:hypothetical protein CDS [Bradyrhizobium sp.]|nr:hypothetical protein CDS [Bradyrhizobium sp.]